jgi:hypothetical protein
LREGLEYAADSGVDESELDFDMEDEIEESEVEGLEDLDDEDAIGGDDLTDDVIEEEEATDLDDYVYGDDEELEASDDMGDEEELVEEEEAGDNCGAEELNMAEAVDEDEEVDFVDVQEDVAAIVSGMIVARMSKTHDNAQNVKTAGFKAGFKKTVAKVGLKRALESAGMKTITLKAPTLAALLGVPSEVTVIPATRPCSAFIGLFSAADIISFTFTTETAPVTVCTAI